MIFELEELVSSFGGKILSLKRILLQKYTAIKRKARTVLIST